MQAGKYSGLLLFLLASLLARWAFALFWLIAGAIGSSFRKNIPRQPMVWWLHTATSGSLVAWYWSKI